VKTIILAGGFGTRIAEETALKPKPMVEIGGHPLLWHIMQIYAHQGYNDFVVACGYRGSVIKEYFASFDLNNSDLAVDLASGAIDIQRRHQYDWQIACVDTGAFTMTGGRIKALEDAVGDSTFMVTYGDGLANVNIADLLSFHQEHGRLATVTAVHPPARFGTMDLTDDGTVTAFQEKVQSREGWINGGFFVFEPGVFDYIAGSATRLEAEPLSDLASAGELKAYRHEGFWQPMDTLRERNELEQHWETGEAPWKVW
jgi:glucose-1-phosphate cytidylyltransferase